MHTTFAFRRLLAGAALLVFVAVFFAAPLYAAANLCKLPCCHASTRTIIVAGMPGCAPPCAIRADDVTAATAARAVTPVKRAATDMDPTSSAVATDVSPTVAEIAEAEAPPRCRPAPAYILNSVFRI